MSGKRPALYSLQHVHCAHCDPPCSEPTKCLKDDMLRGKCPSAKRRDDLKKHTAVNHPKQPKAVEDGKQGSIRDFFRKSKEHPSTSIAESEPPQPLVEALLPISSIPEPDTLSVSPDQPTCNR